MAIAKARTGQEIDSKGLGIIGSEERVVRGA
jgi:hypothetical protein